MTDSGGWGYRELHWRLKSDIALVRGARVTDKTTRFNGDGKLSLSITIDREVKEIRDPRYYAVFCAWECPTQEKILLERGRLRAERIVQEAIPRLEGLCPKVVVTTYAGRSTPHTAMRDSRRRIPGTVRGDFLEKRRSHSPPCRGMEHGRQFWPGASSIGQIRALREI